MPRDYRQLKVFEAADDFVLHIYEATRDFPKAEMFGLTSQMRRAAVSAASNIVEGASRESEKEFLHQLSISCGSLAEVGYYVGLAQRLGYLEAITADDLRSRYEENEPDAQRPDPDPAQELRAMTKRAHGLLLLRLKAHSS